MGSSHSKPSKPSTSRKPLGQLRYSCTHTAKHTKTPSRNFVWEVKRIEAIAESRPGQGYLARVKYVEDKDDHTPCLLLIFQDESSIPSDDDLVYLRRKIEKDPLRLDRFRVDFTLEGREDERVHLVERAAQHRMHHQKRADENGKFL